jgi:hypothetical protein
MDLFEVCKITEALEELVNDGKKICESGGRGHRGSGNSGSSTRKLKKPRGRKGSSGTAVPEVTEGNSKYKTPKPVKKKPKRPGSAARKKITTTTQATKTINSTTSSSEITTFSNIETSTMSPSEVSNPQTFTPIAGGTGVMSVIPSPQLSGDSGDNSNEKRKESGQSSGSSSTDSFPSLIPGLNLPANPLGAIDAIIPVIMPDLNPLTRKIINRKIKKIEKNLTAGGFMARRALLAVDAKKIVIPSTSKQSSLTSSSPTPLSLVTLDTSMVKDTDDASVSYKGMSRESRPRLVIPRPASAVKGKRERRVPSFSCWFLMPALISSTTTSRPSSDSIVPLEGNDDEEKRDQIEKIDQEDETEEDTEATADNREEIIESSFSSDKSDRISDSLSGQMDIYSNSSYSSPKSGSTTSSLITSQKRQKRESNPQFNVKTLIATFKSIQSGNFSGGLLQPLMVSN